MTRARGASQVGPPTGKSRAREQHPRIYGQQLDSTGACLGVGKSLTGSQHACTVRRRLSPSPLTGSAHRCGSRASLIPSSSFHDLRDPGRFTQQHAAPRARSSIGWSVPLSDVAECGPLVLARGCCNSSEQHSTKSHAAATASSSRSYAALPTSTTSVTIVSRWRMEGRTV